jgi:hypothetical protein
MLIGFVHLIGCGDPVTYEAIGAACSREAATVCESPANGEAGPCLLDLPGGMCSYECADDAEVCPDGFSCGTIAGGRYCLAVCDDDDDCRDDMICVVGECRGEGTFGDGCGEDADCASGFCHAGACSTRCDEQGDCAEGVSCVDLGDGTGACVDLGYGDECETHGECASGICHEGRCNVECHAERDCVAGRSCVDLGDGVPICVEYIAPTGGEGTWGEGCTFGECADGFDCLARTADPGDDPYAYCSRSCLNDLDCPADMTCRRTQQGDEGGVGLRCVPREYCERCAHDGQCGSLDERCVSQDPRRGAGRYCSQTCDPERAVTTCPTDSTCHEAQWCQPDRAWVASCEWCSDPERCGASESGAVFQCFHDYGACAGGGEDYCSPCWVDEDCPEGGHCRYEPYTANSYCTTPCTEEGEVRTCPYEHYCQQFGLPFENRFECLPRQGSCSQPSGGQTTCYGCAGFGDCVSGLCLPEELQDGRPTVCYEDCAAGPQECPPYTQCNRYSDADGNAVFLCARHEDLRNCGEVLNCREECPEGPSSCSDAARSYCR